MHIFTAKHWKEVRVPYGRVWERIEGTERDINPIDQQYQLTWTPRNSKRLSYQPKHIHGMVQGPQHRCCRGLPCLASVGKDVLNPVET